MKKISIFISAVVVFLFGVLIGGYTQKNKEGSLVENYTNSNFSHNDNDTINTYNEKIASLIENGYFLSFISEEVENKNDKYYIYFGRDDCPGCQEFLPDLEKVIYEKKVPVYYVDTNIKNKQLEELLSEYNIEYVPTLMKVEERKGITFNLEKDNLTLFID